MLTPLLWSVQGECLKGRNQSIRLLPITSLMFCNGPQSHGLNPAGLSRIAKVRTGESTGEGLIKVDVCAGGFRLCCKRACCSCGGLGYLMVRRAVPGLFPLRRMTSSGLGI